MTDSTRRRLHMPNWYAPYLEKHRIYDLFHEMISELLIQQPDDHVLFLKEVLYNASCNRNAPRIILLTTSHVNVYEIAQLLAGKCEATIVSEQDILTLFDNKRKKKITTRALTRALAEVLRTENIYNTGWILINYPKTRKEAKYMLRAGILPTHVLQLIPPFAPSFDDLEFDKTYREWAQVRRTMLGLRDVFKNDLKEVHVEEKNLAEISDECFGLVRITKRHKAPVIPRVCILGPRGSGRKTQAKLLANTFNLVLIDFESVLCESWVSDSELGRRLNQCRLAVGRNSVLLTAVLHKRILQADCLERGWVLTGFPNTAEDFMNLDMVDTPPNRVVFLECDLNTCKERVVDRRVNVYSGSVTNLSSQNSGSEEFLRLHPKDREKLVESELKYYCENYNSLRKYCGKTVCAVEGTQPVQWVYECISAFLMRPLANGEPRCPCPAAEQPVDSPDDSGDECLCNEPNLL